MFFIYNILKIMTAFQFIWTNTIIEIPLNDNIEKYIHLPQAEIYDNNQKIDTEIYYTKGVNHTFISVLNSRHVKKYYIYYEAYAPEYQIYSTMQIVFDVVDKIPPNLTVKEQLESPLNEKILEIADYIQFNDNYDKKEDLKIIIDTKRVNTKVIGTYDVYITIMDKSNNSTTKIIKYTIFDHIKPTIDIVKEPKITVNEFINLKNYFNFKDNYDQNLTIWYDESKINFNKIGVYPLIVFVKDSSGNENSLSTTLNVIDDRPPELIIQSNIPALNYLDSIDDEYLKKYILSVYDNYDYLSKEDVIITHDIQTNYLGKYNIYYHLKDSSGNHIEKKVSIEVKDLETPKVEIKKDLIILVFSDQPYIYDYFKFTDNYTDENKLTIKITEKINTKIIGEYPINIEITDESKNTFKGVFKFTVKDDIAPTIEQINDIILNIYENINYKDFFLVKDNYDKDIKIIFDDQDINYNKVGKYPLKVNALDQSLNEIIYETYVYIMDLISPKIVLKKDYINYFIGDEIPDLKNIVQNIYDNYSEISLENIKIIENVNYDKIGLYEIKYQVYDHSNNLGETILNLYIDLKPKIEFNVMDFKVKLGENINFSNFLNYSDQTLDVKHNQEIVNKNITGIYYVTYYVTNQRGLTNIYTQKVEIIDEKIDFNDYILPFIIVAATSLSIIFIRKKATFF